MRNASWIAVLILGLTLAVGCDASSEMAEDAASSSPVDAGASAMNGGDDGTSGGGAASAAGCEIPPEAGSFYSFSAQSFDDFGAEVRMCRYRDDVLMIVNTAALCGLAPQYEGLQALQEQYASQGFRVLGFLSNDFANQGGSKEQIDACNGNYGVTFEQFMTVGVTPASENGLHPIFRWLTSQSGMEGDIGWNFAKFLVGRDGRLIARWDSIAQPNTQSVRDAIEAALAE